MFYALLSKYARYVFATPIAIRPWQHVLEPLSGYLMLAQALYEEGEKYSGGWNFGPNDEDAKPVQWIVEQMTSKWGLMPLGLETMANIRMKPII
jgi:hypothetical protein